jgi:hypothetical protein
MANITDKTTQIRNAVYGKDVREAIASGIEAISNQQDLYESNLTSRQDTFEQRLNDAETVRSNNENTRQFNEQTRQANEATRQNIYNEFRDFVNTAQQINRVPYLFDGGDFGDISSPVLTLNGGDF